MVDADLRSKFESRYKDPKDVVFTFYLFVDENYNSETTSESISSKAKSAYSSFAVNTVYGGNTGRTQQNVVDDWITQGDRFLDSAEIAQVRVVGAMPFVDKTADGLYAGNQVFRQVGQSMIDAYLTKGATVAGSWTIPAGVEGIDRLGLGGWFRKSDGSRIGSATYSDSFALPRSINSQNFLLPEDWYGFDSATYDQGRFNNVAGSTYREIWVRSYDTRNRQIQTVESATRTVESANP
jgi:hypothetical protein